MDRIPSSTNQATGDQDRLDQKMFYLDSTQAKDSLKLLDESAPTSKSNPGLDRLMAISPPWSQRRS